MITNRDFFAALTVPQLKAVLADFNAVGISKLRKAELVSMVICLMDGAHLDAEAENRTHVVRKIAAGYFNKVATVGGSPMTASARADYYMAQNGCSRLTPAQRRRLGKKIFKAGKLS